MRKQMKTSYLAGLILVYILTSSVFAASPKPSGYLADYGHLEHGEFLEAFWADKIAAAADMDTEILLGEVSTEKIKKHKGVTVEDCVNWLTTGLQEHAWISTGFADASYRLDLAITHMDPGSASKRILAGELGAGHAQVQVEGKLIEMASGKTVAEFAERRSSSGALGLEDLKGDSGPELIEHLLGLISDDAAAELKAIF